MTRTKILAAATAHRGNADTTRDDAPRLWFPLLATCLLGSIVLIAAGATFHDIRHDAPPPSTESDFDERWISIQKGDRLALPTPTPLPAATVQSEVTPPVAAPHQQLPIATEDDIRQAEAEHHRHGDICPHGRTFFFIGHHQYWRCVR
jgi:hypothetical protein